MTVIENMDYSQLKSLRDDVDTLMTQRRNEALEELKKQAAALDFPVETLFATMNGKRPAKYVNPDNPEETYNRGKYPAWLKAKLDAGHSLEEFVA